MKKILIIDEAEAFRKLAEKLCIQNNLEPHLAINGLDGHSKMLSIIPDLIIMEKDLTRMDSLAILAKKKSNPNTSNIPVVFKYESGGGELDEEQTSGSDGTVQSTIHKISSYEEEKLTSIKEESTVRFPERSLMMGLTWKKQSKLIWCLMKLQKPVLSKQKRWF